MTDDGWKDKYKVKQLGSVGACWAVFSTSWSYITPMKRVSPWFDRKSEAQEWIQVKWDEHVAKKFENAFLGKSED